MLASTPIGHRSGQQPEHGHTVGLDVVVNNAGTLPW